MPIFKQLLFSENCDGRKKKKQDVIIPYILVLLLRFKQFTSEYIFQGGKYCNHGAIKMISAGRKVLQLTSGLLKLASYHGSYIEVVYGIVCQTPRVARGQAHMKVQSGSGTRKKTLTYPFKTRSNYPLFY